MKQGHRRESDLGLLWAWSTVRAGQPWGSSGPPEDDAGGQGGVLFIVCQSGTFPEEGFNQADGPGL